jgi:hypothetical protein
MIASSPNAGGPAGDQFPGSFQLLFAIAPSVQVCVSATAAGAKKAQSSSALHRAQRPPRDRQLVMRIAGDFIAPRGMAQTGSSGRSEPV